MAKHIVCHTPTQFATHLLGSLQHTNSNTAPHPSRTQLLHAHELQHNNFNTAPHPSRTQLLHAHELQQLGSARIALVHTMASWSNQQASGLYKRQGAADLLTSHLDNRNRLYIIHAAVCIQPSNRVVVPHCNCSCLTVPGTGFVKQVCKSYFAGC
jgi:hypothetical protein